MSIRLGLIFPGVALVTTCANSPLTQPATYLLVMACQQIWPFNVYPGSSDDSHYIVHAELALHLNRLTAGSL